MLTIGEFSRICFVTKKTLRHYDEIGLLRPEHTAENGYRYYTVGQLRTMQLISRLKIYGLSLPEIADIIAQPDSSRLAVTLARKHREMQAQMDNTRHVLQQMEQDIEKLKRSMDIMDKNIAIKTIELEPRQIYSIRGRMSVLQMPQLIERAYREAAEKKLEIAGPPMTFYHDEDYDDGFDQQHADIEVGFAVNGTGEGVRTQEGGLHCFATLVGPYESEGFTTTYAALMEWVEQNGYRIASAPFDKYVRGGPDCAPEEYVTEIYFPIQK